MPLYTFVDNAVPTSSQWNSNVRDQVVTQCTSGTRPGTPVEGQYIYETDTDRTLVYSGSAWIIMSEPTQSWTPSVTQGVGVTSTVSRAWSRRSNGLWIAQAVITLTSAGTLGSGITMTLPYTMVNANDIGGTFRYTDTGTSVYTGVAVTNTTTACIFYVHNAGSSFGGTPSFAIANNDVFQVTLTGTY